jgi:hypothetical protein
MRCWNCNKKIPDKAQVCEFCEASMEGAPTEEEKDIVRGLLREMPPEVIEDLRAAMDGTNTAEEFADRIFVGDCPKCGSTRTGNCESDPEINDLLVGRCYECGQLFCTECEKLLTAAAPSCDCLDEEDDEFDEFDEFDDEWDDEEDEDEEEDDEEAE